MVHSVSKIEVLRVIDLISLLYSLWTNRYEFMADVVGLGSRAKSSPKTNITIEAKNTNEKSMTG